MLNDKNITFLFYPFKFYEKNIIDELFRFSLAVSAIENDDEYRTFQDYPTYDPRYGPNFSASRKRVGGGGIYKIYLPAAKVIKLS